MGRQSGLFGLVGSRCGACGRRLRQAPRLPLALSPVVPPLAPGDVPPQPAPLTWRKEPTCPAAIISSWLPRPVPGPVGVPAEYRLPGHGQPLRARRLSFASAETEKAAANTPIRRRIRRRWAARLVLQPFRIAGSSQAFSRLSTNWRGLAGVATILAALSAFESNFSPFSVDSGCSTSSALMSRDLNSGSGTDEEVRKKLPRSLKVEK